MIAAVVCLLAAPRVQLFTGAGNGRLLILCVCRCAGVVIELSVGRHEQCDRCVWTHLRRLPRPESNRHRRRLLPASLSAQSEVPLGQPRSSRRRRGRPASEGVPGGRRSDVELPHRLRPRPQHVRQCLPVPRAQRRSARRHGLRQLQL